MGTNKNQPKPESVIGPSMVINGDVVFNGKLTVNGRIDGSVQGDRVEIGRQGGVAGDLKLHDIDCQGVLEGRLEAGRLILHPGAEARGDLFVDELSMTHGALLAGSVQCLSRNQEVMPDSLPIKGKSTIVPAENEDAESPKKNQVSDTDRSVPGSSDHETVMTSLVAALQGDSEFVIVVSDQRETRRQFRDTFQHYLARYFQTVAIDNPQGAVRDILLRIADILRVSPKDYSNNAQICAELLAAMQQTAQDGKSTVILVENGEKMFPATLEGLLKHFSGKGSEGPMAGFVLLGNLELERMKEFDTSGTAMREPDCTFRL